jgi:hypothetical protein
MGSIPWSCFAVGGGGGFVCTALEHLDGIGGLFAIFSLGGWSGQVALKED